MLGTLPGLLMLSNYHNITLQTKNNVKDDKKMVRLVMVTQLFTATGHIKLSRVTGHIKLFTATGHIKLFTVTGHIKLFTATGHIKMTKDMLIVDKKNKD